MKKPDVKKEAGQSVSVFRKHRAALLLVGVLIPLTAYPLDLSDYLNTSSVTASSSQFETELGDNTSTIQITPNAEIIILKNIVNDNGGNATLADFTIGTDAGTPAFDAGVTTGDTTTYTSDTLYVAPGSYTLTESDVAGYTEGSWACTVGTVGDTTFSSGSVTLGFGEQTVCTITNDDVAPTLTLAKTLTQDDGGTETIDDFDISIDGTEVTLGTPVPVAANTTITVSELALPGYTAGAWSCTDANGLTTGLPTAGLATGTDVVLAEGADVTCSIINDDIGPQLKLIATLINDNGGTGTIDDFDMSYTIDTVGTEVVSGDFYSVPANKAITISELDLPAYAEGTWSCTDANGLTTVLPTAGVATGEVITLAPGSEVTCEITNDDFGIDLAIAKSVDDETPNIGDTITFTLAVTNSGPDEATDVTVADIVPAGFTYVTGSALGGNSQDDADPTGAGLSWTISSVPANAAAIELTFQATVNAP